MIEICPNDIQLLCLKIISITINSKYFTKRKKTSLFSSKHNYFIQIKHKFPLYIPKMRKLVTILRTDER